MTTILVWVLVYATHVNSGGVANVIGDYATVEDCERVKAVLASIASKETNGASAQCVQVKKVKQ
jgi:hypothetical protein